MQRIPLFFSFADKNILSCRKTFTKALEDMEKYKSLFNGTFGDVGVYKCMIDSEKPRVRVLSLINTEPEKIELPEYVYLLFGSTGKFYTYSSYGKVLRKHFYSLDSCQTDIFRDERGVTSRTHQIVKCPVDYVVDFDHIANSDILTNKKFIVFPITKYRWT